MREIKYKVWHKVENRMYWFDLNWGTMYDAGSGWWAVVPWGEKRKHHPDNRYIVDPGTCVPLEYTGLKDKNGVEIYEGDVIRDCNGLPDTWVVEWSVEEAGFLGLDWCGKPNEVIGNIYEHPGLIKEDK